jgi:hypothetical protein
MIYENGNRDGKTETKTKSLPSTNPPTPTPLPLLPQLSLLALPAPHIGAERRQVLYSAWDGGGGRRDDHAPGVPWFSTMVRTVDS